MEAKDRIIVVLDDVKQIQVGGKLLEVRYFVRLPHRRVGMFQIGPELIHDGGRELVQFINDECKSFYFAGKPDGNPSRIFYNAHLLGDPDSMANTARAITCLGVGMFSVHCLGGMAMMQTVVKATKEEAIHKNRERPLIFGVLNSGLDYEILLEEFGIVKKDYHYLEAYYKEVEKKLRLIITKLALIAQEAKLDGVIVSSRYVELLRRWCRREFLIIVSDVFPIWSAESDQGISPAKAIEVGADYLSIGNPITDPPQEIGGSLEALERIVEEIELVCSKKGEK